MMSAPKGIGIYLRDTDPKKAKAMAKLAKANGVSYVATLACWQDYKNGKPNDQCINSAAEVHRIEQEFIAQGIDHWLWGFPRAGAHESFVQTLAAATSKDTEGWIIDPEVYFKWKGRGKSEAVMRAHAKALVDLVLSEVDQSSLGVTSYGMKDYHKNFPWEEFAFGFGSPQLYVLTDAEVHQGLQSWVDHETIIPSVPAFGAKSGAKLHDYLSDFLDADVTISGFLVWSWPQISADEWRVLKRWAGWFATDKVQS
jgi:hypothetical protein